MKCEKCGGPMVKAGVPFPVFLPKKDKIHQSILLETYICSDCGHTEFKAEEENLKLLKNYLEKMTT